jgi:hypothetical protein
MKPLRVAFTTCAAALLLTCALPSTTHAQLDHLLCNRMIDKTQVKAAVDLFAELQPEFNQQGCTLVKPFDFCVPVTKKNVQPPAPLNISGQPLSNDYICYLLKCPDKPVVPDRIVADQFGRRLQRGYKPYKLCVPAQKAPPPCGPTSSARQCGGTCDDPGVACHYDKVAKICTCAPPPQNCGGPPDAAGQCGGTCQQPGDACIPVLTGTKAICTCQPPPPPACGLNPATGTCGGSCKNSNDKCVLKADGSDCICQPVEPGCTAGSPPNQCSGPCTDPTFTCGIDSLTNQCRCAPPPQSCGPNPLTGQCGGTCATTGTTCRFINTAGSPGHCVCQ